MTQPAQSIPPARPVRRRSGRKLAALRILVLAIGILPAFDALAGDSEIPTLTRMLGAFLWFLCVLPGYFYLRSHPAARRPLPFIQAISFIYGLYYAFPIALGEANRAWRITVDPRDGYDTPIQLAFFGWVAMMLSYLVVTHLFRNQKPPREIPWNPALVARWGIFFLVSGITVNALRTVLGNITAIGGFLQLFVSMQWLGLGLLTVLSRRKELRGPGRVVLVLGFFAGVAVALAQGNISPVVLLCIVIAFALWTGRNQIEARWIIAGGMALIMAVALRGVIRDFRMTAWYGTQQFTQTQRAQLMIKLLADRVGSEGFSGALGGGVSQTAQRSANMDLFADVVRRTPSEIPHWKGQTYYSLIGAAVPRMLWPNKPTKELGQAFGHRYRYLDPTNLSTAINLPILIEFYVNFGGAAVVVGMLLVGALYGLLDTVLNKPRQSLLISMIGLTLLLPLLIIESDFSLVFGGLPLSGVALWGIWILMRRSALGRNANRRRATARVSPMEPRNQLQTGPDRPVLPAG